MRAALDGLHFRQANALCVTSAKDAVRLPADLRVRVMVMPVAVAWFDPAALDRVLKKALPARSRNIDETELTRRFLNDC